MDDIQNQIFVLIELIMDCEKFERYKYNKKDTIFRAFTIFNQIYQQEESKKKETLELIGPYIYNYDFRRSKILNLLNDIETQVNRYPAGGGLNKNSKRSKRSKKSKRLNKRSKKLNKRSKRLNKKSKRKKLKINISK